GNHHAETPSPSRIQLAVCHAVPRLLPKCTSQKSCERPSRVERAGKPHAVSEGTCCDTFNRIPMPTRLISSDEPPALTNGNGMPLVGSRPRTTLMLKNA